MRDEVADPLAFEVGFAIVVERLLVLLSGHHLVSLLKRSRRRFPIQVAIAQKPSASRIGIKDPTLVLAGDAVSQGWDLMHSMTRMPKSASFFWPIPRM